MRGLSSYGALVISLTFSPAGAVRSSSSGQTAVLVEENPDLVNDANDEYADQENEQERERRRRSLLQGERPSEPSEFLMMEDGSNKLDNDSDQQKQQSLLQIEEGERQYSNEALRRYQELKERAAALQRRGFPKAEEIDDKQDEKLPFAREDEQPKKRVEPTPFHDEAMEHDFAHESLQDFHADEDEDDIEFRMRRESEQVDNSEEDAAHLLFTDPAPKELSKNDDAFLQEESDVSPQEALRGARKEPQVTDEIEIKEQHAPVAKVNERSAPDEAIVPESSGQDQSAKTLVEKLLNSIAADEQLDKKLNVESGLVASDYMKFRDKQKNEEVSLSEGGGEDGQKTLLESTATENLSAEERLGTEVAIKAQSRSQQELAGWDKCWNNLDWKDKKGYSCLDWGTPYDCFDAHSKYGYSLQDQKELIQNCSQTCTRCGVTGSYFCHLPLNKGNSDCSNFSNMWYFNSQIGKCELFKYSGCGGNKNRFSSQEDCTDLCVRIDDSSCSWFGPDTGMPNCSYVKCPEHTYEAERSVHPKGFSVRCLRWFGGTRKKCCLKESKEEKWRDGQCPSGTDTKLFYGVKSPDECLSQCKRYRGDRYERAKGCEFTVEVQTRDKFQETICKVIVNDSYFNNIPETLYVNHRPESMMSRKCYIFINQDNKDMQAPAPDQLDAIQPDSFGCYWAGPGKKDFWPNCSRSQCSDGYIEIKRDVLPEGYYMSCVGFYGGSRKFCCPLPDLCPDGYVDLDSTGRPCVNQKTPIMIIPGFWNPAALVLKHYPSQGLTECPNEVEKTLVPGHVVFPDDAAHNQELSVKQVGLCYLKLLRLEQEKGDDFAFGGDKLVVRPTGFWRSKLSANDGNQEPKETWFERAIKLKGYIPDRNLKILNYDWRLRPDQLQKRDRLFTEMKFQIEELYRANGRRAVKLIGLEMGSILQHSFLRWVYEQAVSEVEARMWFKTFIEGVTNVAAPFFGTTNAVTQYVEQVRYPGAMAGDEMSWLGKWLQDWSNPNLSDGKLMFQIYTPSTVLQLPQQGIAFWRKEKVKFKPEEKWGLIDKLLDAVKRVFHWDEHGEFTANTNLELFNNIRTLHNLAAVPLPPVPYVDNIVTTGTSTKQPLFQFYREANMLEKVPDTFASTLLGNGFSTAVAQGTLPFLWQNDLWYRIDKSSQVFITEITSNPAIKDKYSSTDGAEILNHRDLVNRILQSLKLNPEKELKNEVSTQILKRFAAKRASMLKDDQTKEVLKKRFHNYMVKSR